MINNRKRRHQWSDLPKELLETIVKCIGGSPVEILRLRSVCSSWRASVSVPSFDEAIIPSLILKLPSPISSSTALLSQSTIFRIEFNSPNPKGWLIKLRESTTGKLELLHPLTDYRIRYSPLKLNFIDFRFTRLSKAFLLKCPSGSSVYGIEKVVEFPSKEGFAILAIFHEGKLGYWKFGDENWTLLNVTDCQYDDIIEYKSQFYVVDRWGTVSWIDSSLRLIQYSPSLFGCGGQKNLVESCGELYIVDRYLDGEQRKWTDYEFYEALFDTDIPAPHWDTTYSWCVPNAIDFKVYKLDEDWGKWVNVKSLGDRVFILGVDSSYSVASGEFNGGKGNCIYFTDEHEDFRGRGSSNDSFHVFRLDDHKIEKVPALSEYSGMFWPPNFTHFCAEDTRK